MTPTASLNRRVRRDAARANRWLAGLAAAAIALWMFSERVGESPHDAEPAAPEGMPSTDHRSPAMLSR